jgi:hypothetical protein
MVERCGGVVWSYRVSPHFKGGQWSVRENISTPFRGSNGTGVGKARRAGSNPHTKDTTN